MKTLLKPHKHARPEIILPVATSDHNEPYHDIKFVLDPGSEYSLMSVRVAELYKIPFVRNPDPTQPSCILHTMWGLLRVHRDNLQLRIGASTVVVPCDFAEDPPPDPETGKVRKPLPVLGRAEFLDRYKVVFNYPVLTIRRQSWWDKFWAKLQTIFIS